MLHLQGHDASARQACERAIQTERKPRRPWGVTLATAHYLLMSVLEATGDLAALDSTRAELVKLADAYARGSTMTRATVHYWSARAARRLGRAAEAFTEALEADRSSRELLHLNAQALPDRRARELAGRQSRFLDLVLDLSRGGDPQRLAIAWDRLVRSRGLVAPSSRGGGCRPRCGPTRPSSAPTRGGSMRSTA